MFWKENETSQCQFLKKQDLPWLGQVTSHQVTYQVTSQTWKSSFRDCSRMCLGTFASVNNWSHLYPIIACVPVKVKVKVFSAKNLKKVSGLFCLCPMLNFFVASFISSACAGVLLHLWLLPAPLPHRLPLLHHDPQASHSGEDSGLWESNIPWKNRLILLCLWYVTMHNVPVVK